jgi:hypothetical protein
MVSGVDVAADEQAQEEWVRARKLLKGFDPNLTQALVAVR